MRELHQSLIAQRDAIVDEVVEEIPREIPFYAALPRDARRPAAGRFVDVMLDALIEYTPEAVRAWGSETFTRRHEQGASLGQILATLRLLRRTFMRHLLGCRASPGVLAAAVERTNDVFDDLIGTASPIFQQRLEETARAFQEVESRYRQIYLRTPAMMHSLDPQGRIMTVSDRWLEVFGYARDEVLGRRSVEFFTEASRRFALEEGFPLVRAGGTLRDAPMQFVKKSGEVVDILLSSIALRNVRGEIDQFVAVLVDVTERLQTERALRESEEARRHAEAEAQVLRAQEELLRALSTPLIPIGDGVLIMPIVGRVTADRAARILEELAAGVVAQQASVAILDVTGVPEADAGIAAAIVRVGQAIRLLGAQVVLTGIQPSMARTLVELGADLGELVTRGTLRDGIAFAMSQARPGRAR